MFTYDMSQTGKTPLYLYLYELIRDDILNGNLKSGEKLPSKRSLAGHLGLSVITVQNAYEILLVEGYLYSKEKVGYFVENIKKKPAPPKREKKIDYSIYQGADVEHEWFADFSSNKIQPSLFPVASIAKITREMIALNNPDFLKTVPYNGTSIFRNAIADYLQEYRGMEVDPEQIIIGCGTEYLYGRLLQLFPEDTILMLEDPGNHKFASIAKQFHLDVEYLSQDHRKPADHLRKKHAALLHISPANTFPEGKILPIRNRYDILDWLEADPGHYVIEDDFDSEFNYHGRIPAPLFSMDSQEKVIYMNTFSKTLLPSLRVGYLVLPHSLLRRYYETLTFYSCTESASDQYILARFLSEGYYERHLNHARTYLKTEQKKLAQEISLSELGKCGDIITPPAGTILVWESHTPLNQESIKERARENDIKFAFVSDYAYHKAPEMERKIILNYASIPKERIPEAVRRLSCSIIGKE